MNQKIFRKENGITLIALVITIIVLLILAGVSISMLTGENGILKKTSEATETYGVSQASEYLDLAKTELMTNKQSTDISLDEYLEFLENDGRTKVLKKVKNSAYVKVDGKYVFLIEQESNEDIKITYQENNVDKDNEDEEQPIVPSVTVTQSSVSTDSIEVTVSATEGEAGMETSVTYSYYIKPSSETNYSLVETSNSTSYKFTGLTDNTSYDIKVTVADKAGNVGEKELTGVLTDKKTVTISTTENYVGYYADLEGDGKVDGVIYADLAVGGEGKWNNDTSSAYSYEKVTKGLKSYTISEEEYTGFNEKWTKPVLTVVQGSGTVDRFYVMALEDFAGRWYYWYNAASELDNTIQYNYNDFGDGKENTKTMINKWNTVAYGAQNSNDMWGAIQTLIIGNINNLKWFVPSKAEWAAFGDFAFTEMGLTTSDYSDYGLSGYCYWSSTQSDADMVFAFVIQRWLFGKLQGQYLWIRAFEHYFLIL